MSVQRFEDLEIWRNGLDIAEKVYRIFMDSRVFSFKDQVLRSSLSVPSNIAEGFERGSDNEFIRFLRYAVSSNGELRTQLYLAERLGFADKEKTRDLINETLIQSKRISALIRYRDERRKREERKEGQGDK